MKVTRVAYSDRLNVGKYAVLAEQARRPGGQRRQLVKIPLNTTVAPTGTLRLILRNNRVEIHYQIDTADMRTSQKPASLREIGVDKGYTEVRADSDGQHHGTGLGRLLSTESDSRKRKAAPGRNFAPLPTVASPPGRKASRLRRSSNVTAIPTSPCTPHTRG